MNRILAPLVHAFDAPPFTAAGIFAPRPRWTTPEPGLHTVACGDRILGHVVVVRSGYVSFDAEGSPIGRFDSLQRARRSVIGAENRRRMLWV